MATSISGLCSGSACVSGAYSLGSNPGPGAKSTRPHGQAAKTSPSQGEIRGSIPLGATKRLIIDCLKEAILVFKKE